LPVGQFLWVPTFNSLNGTPVSTLMSRGRPTEWADLADRARKFAEAAAERLGAFLPG
jgi:hypothetical protein|tara:strand:- start:118 stop:288 length:171 start_codon:yes stop_codon:yes gene_type:complete